MKDSSWLTPLHHAAAQGHTAAVRELLLRQADVMARDRLWMTPLHLAAHNNHVKCAGTGIIIQRESKEYVLYTNNHNYCIAHYVKGRRKEKKEESKH